MTLADSIHEASRSLSAKWVGGCERLLAVHGATPATHVLCTRHVPGGQDASGLRCAASIHYARRMYSSVGLALLKRGRHYR